MIPSTTAATTIILLCTLSLSSLHYLCYATRENITAGSAPIADNVLDILVSPGNKFQMGFFPSGKNWNNRRYVGIWYTMDPSTVVWVANRENPLLDTTGILTVTEDGNLKVLDKDKKIYFSTELGVPNIFRTLKLLDSGNAVLVDDKSGEKLWQSFKNVTDTFLPGMMMDENLKLTSWKNETDPGPGNFTFQQDPQSGYVILKASAIDYWKIGGSGSGLTSIFNPTQLDNRVYLLLTNHTTQGTNHEPGGYNISSYSPLFRNNSRLVMNFSGEIQYLSWNEEEKKWVTEWFEPRDNCSVHKACGPYGKCGNNGCECLRGFEPGKEEKWKSGEYTSGCKRRFDICGEHDKFLNLTRMKVEKPTSQFSKSGREEECKNKCLQLCQCQAYSYSPGNNDSIRAGRPGSEKGCWIWDSDLFDLQENGILDIAVRVGNSINLTGSDNPHNNPNQSSEGSQPKSSSSSRKRVIIIASIIIVILLLCIISYISYRTMVTNRRESNQRNSVLQLNESERRVKDLLDLDQSRRDEMQSIDLPFFELESILAATNNFSDANKLGQGGFGPVYKGTLPGGLEIAVKRLSISSGQGLEEFRNEVVLIAKLQHRNLVRVLGYCMNGNEKILLYEYMTNKSLDAFIFDRTLSTSLDWTKRFDIILGIARGLLYLHQDSRLRIIHRDLKTSNILLDEEMNPKISDFGLAKIVKGKEMEASTNRVIGTYGYMSPEYALDGLFSVKSDVFSFGVVVLEIISGKKNTGFYQPQQPLNLLGYAWSLWKEDKAVELMDQTLVESCNSTDVLKCILVGLLCVQEDPNDRPTMTNVVFMLGSDMASLPNPKQPAFVARTGLYSSSSSSNKPNTQTVNMMTMTMDEGR